MPTASRPGASPAPASRARLGKAIGIAWVPVEQSEEGTAIRISDPKGSTIPATVTHKAFYDPDGERLRS